MTLRTTSALLIAVALVAAACSGSSGETTTTTTAGTTTTSGPTTTTPPASTTSQPPVRAYMPEFESAECDFDIPLEADEPDCGYLVVPEDRNDPDGDQVRLHVAIFEATGDDPQATPLIYLEGGPGGHTLGALQFSYSSSFAPLNEQHDLILFDQRGIGTSEPALDCPEERQVQIEYLDDDVEDEVYLEAYEGALITCRDRLLADGVDLSDYNSASNAADVADLRVALGYDEVNLWGISYGTRLALTVMRDHPEGIRSVVLDSTVPVDLDLYPAIPASADRSFDLLFAGCAADPACAAAYPDLEAEFVALAERLNEDPVDIVLTDFIDGSKYPALLFGDDLYSMTFNGLYSESIIPLLPGFIYDGAQGDYAGLERLSSVFFTNGPFLSSGMYLSVQCNEEYIFSTPDEVLDAVDAHPDVAAMFSSAESEFDDCALWGAGTADPIEDEPVSSTIPTLILAGEYDPITPPSYGLMAAETLSNSTYFEFQGLGHGVSTADECPTSILLAFVDDPAAEPDGSCIDELGPPNFFVEGNITITLVPFEADVFGTVVTGVRPEEWDDTGFGSFTAPGLGDVAIVQQAVSGSFVTTDLMREQMLVQLGIEDDATSVSYEDTAGREWQVSTGSDGTLTYDIAVTEADGYLYLVIFVAPADVRSAYLDLVFYPAMDEVNVP